MEFSPKNPASMIGTFGMVLVFTMFKEAYEDYFRHVSDRKVNNAETLKWVDGQWTKLYWKDI
jgi:hypothetical protein